MDRCLMAWLPHLSDLPFLAAEASGILGRLQVDVPARSGLVMIGGAFSFSGLKAVGGWQDPRGASLLPVEPTAGRTTPKCQTQSRARRRHRLPETEGAVEVEEQGCRRPPATATQKTRKAK
jgi:hypothetical protein